MFGFHKKSNLASIPPHDVFYPTKIFLERKIQEVFDKKQCASNGFDFVQKQSKRRNRYDDEKWVRSGDRPFTKAKRNNRDVLDQKEFQTYASLEKMLHKAIHAVRQLKKKANTNTFSAPKQQCKSSYLSNSDLKTNENSFDKSKAVKPTSKALSTRCFKCHKIGHYADKCHKQKPLVTYENVETEPEKEVSFSIQKSDQIHIEHCADYNSFAYNPFPFNDSDLRTNLFEEEGNDVPRFEDQSIGANPHGDHDVLNNSTEVRPSGPTDQTTQARLSRPTRHSKTYGRTRLSLGREETEDRHAVSSDRPSGQSRQRPYLYPEHPDGFG